MTKLYFQTTFTKTYIPVKNKYSVYVVHILSKCFLILVIKIPIIVKVTEDAAEEILFASKCAACGHLVIVHKNAKNVAALLRKMSRKTNENLQALIKEEGGEDPTAYVSLRALLRKFHNQADKKFVQNFFYQAQKLVSIWSK